MNRISISQRDDFDNSSDPAASSSSGDNPASSIGDVPAPSSPDSNRRERGQRTQAQAGADNGGIRPERSSPAAGAGGSARSIDTAGRTRPASFPGASAASAAAPSEADRLAEMRAILPGMSDEELLAMIRENERASNNNRVSHADSETAARMREATSTSAVSGDQHEHTPRQGSQRGTGLSRGSRSSRGSRRRSWVPCQPAPSRPGIFRVGGPIDDNAGGSFDIGETNEVELQIKRIEAVSQVQEALNEKLGRNLRESGEYEAMEREYAEGERMLSSTGLERREKKLLPAMTKWEAPPVSRQSLLRKEPNMPEPGEELPLPLSFGGHIEEGMQHTGGNGEICVGKFVDTAPDEDDDEQKHEIDSESWAEVSIDGAAMGPYDRVVRCWKCRAGLRAHIEVGLVACPRCRTISPATDVADIG